MNSPNSVKSITTNQELVTLSDLPNGEYFIIVLNVKQENISTLKIIKGD
jgi:hypothetical protein